MERQTGKYKVDIETSNTQIFSELVSRFMRKSKTQGYQEFKKYLAGFCEEQLSAHLTNPPEYTVWDPSY